MNPYFWVAYAEQDFVVVADIHNERLARRTLAGGGVRRR